MNWYPWLNGPYRQLIGQYADGRGHRDHGSQSDSTGHARSAGGTGGTRHPCDTARSGAGGAHCSGPRRRGRPP